MSCTFAIGSSSIFLQRYCTLIVFVKLTIFTCGRASLAPTNSVSVKTIVLIFCFDDPEYTDPQPLLPSLIICLVWPRMSGYNMCAASPHHFTTCMPFASSVSLSTCVDCRQFFILPSFSQPSWYD